MLDPVEYKNKPSKSEVRYITERLMQNPVDISIEQLAEEIAKGKTFTPAYIQTLNKDGELRRTKDCWTSQQLVCIDFDNEYKDKDGKVHKHITMTLDDAIKEFQSMATFIYKSFNYKDEHPKFRVVLCLDREITSPTEIDHILAWFKHKYHNSDPQCYERARLFYGGIEIIEINFNNRVNTYDILKSKIPDIKGKNNNDRRKSTQSILGYPKDYLSNITWVLKSHHEVISEKKQEKATFENKLDLMGYLLSRDLFHYLGIENKGAAFCCIFHNDKNPSASIVKNQKGFYFYKCHSSHCGFSGNIFRITERLFGLNNVDAIDYLCQVYNAEVVESEWYVKQKRIYEQNIYYLLSGFMEDEHPELYKFIKKHIPLLVILNQIAIMCIGSETIQRNKKAIWFKPLNEIIEMFVDFIVDIKEIEEKDKKITHDLKELNKRINLFALLGVIEKLHVSEVPRELFLRYTALQKQAGNKRINIPNFYYIPSYDDNVLTNANNMANEFKANNMSKKGFSREMIIRAMGEDVANRVYPMKRNVTISESSNTIAMKVKKLILNMIERDGYAFEKDVIEMADGSKEMNTRVLKRCLQEALNEYGLERVRLNKELKNKLGIEVNGFPNVILRSGTV
ncbi:CHC2 zinc finger domain-containing protein [Brevibacillus gelatini]|nr:CHC2 zinc finger domain-containing protein [Brevibacillus gelatini]